jgi:predicted SnoaL-like aldol condensation-catalyzing enzyme
MIKRETIEGREATVAYLTKDMKPTSPEKADIVKVIFDDGDAIMAVPHRESREQA